MIERAVWMMLKGLAYTLMIGATIAVIIWACCSCGKKTEQTMITEPLQYEDRMKYVGNSKGLSVWVDRETGVCYVASNQGGVCMLVNHDGTPFIANGWRDYDAELD